jgi:hypothetical protein
MGIVVARHARFTKDFTLQVLYFELRSQYFTFFLEQAVFPGILKEVQRLRGVYPSYAVKCTGHSLGAALALLTSFDLKANGISSIVYNFGQPRVGDPQFTKCVASRIPLERVTHLKDTVPHIPYESWGYLHEVREAYESSTTSTNPQVFDVIV